MKGKILALIGMIIGFVFTMLSLLLSYSYRLMQLQAEGTAFAEARDYLRIYPLNVVLWVNVALLILSLAAFVWMSCRERDNASGRAK